MSRLSSPSTGDDVPDPGPGGVDVVIEDRSEAALHRAGGDDPEDGPGGGGGVPDGQSPATVSRTGGVLTQAEAGTQLVRSGGTGPGLGGTEAGGEDGDLDGLQGLGEGRALGRLSPAPASDHSHQAGGDVYLRVRQADGPHVG